MYRLTPKMEQALRQNLRKYHELIDGVRCSGWPLEELIYKAIQSDNITNHHATWKGAKHDDKADIRVKVNGTEHHLQIKSGTLSKNGFLKLSGHRLTRFKGNLAAITEYLNNTEYDMLSVPYRKVDDNRGRHHIYRIVYINRTHLFQLDPSGWAKSGKYWEQTNSHGVLSTLKPSMSWQIWWNIPRQLLNKSDEFIIG